MPVTSVSLVRTRLVQEINEIAAKQIVLLHDEGRLVRWNDVVWRVLTYFRVQDLGHLGLQRADEIACIDHLLRVQNKMNIYLDAYAYSQAMGTLSELENDLARLFNKNDFQELLIGPIEKQPKVEGLFRLRNTNVDAVTKQFKTADILKYLDQYMTKEAAWKVESDINMEDFLRFIAEQVQVKNIYQLGIRIKSVYLARNVSDWARKTNPPVVVVSSQCVKAMQANQQKTMKIARKELNQMLAEVAQQHVARIMVSITDRTENDPLRSRYATMEPLDVIHDLLDLCRDLCQGEYVTGSLPSRSTIV